MRSRPGAARTILLSHIISARPSMRPSKQPLMVRTFLKVYMELGFYFLFLQEQIKDIIMIIIESTLDAALNRTVTHENYRQSSFNIVKTGIEFHIVSSSSTEGTGVAELLPNVDLVRGHPTLHMASSTCWPACRAPGVSANAEEKHLSTPVHPA